MDKLRYIRQNNIIGDDGQKLLYKANILCVGAGGLGTLVSSFLVAAGIGKISLIDEDKIEITNLTRQIVYQEKDCGKSKVDVLHKYLKSLNSECQISSYNTSIDYINANNIVKAHDFIIDCSDNFKTKYLISDTAIVNQKPLISGSIDGFNGQVLVLLNNVCYRCVFPKPQQNQNSCFNGEVIGPAVGIIASYQANEVFKLITGFNSKSILLQIDCIKNNVNAYNIVSDIECMNSHHISNDNQFEDKINFIIWDNLLKLHKNSNLPLIDLRGSNATKLPVKTLTTTLNSLSAINLPHDQSLAVICNYGYKSKLAALRLVSMGYQNVYYSNLL